MLLQKNILNPIFKINSASLAMNISIKNIKHHNILPRVRTNPSPTGTTTPYVWKVTVIFMLTAGTQMPDGQFFKTEPRTDNTRSEP